MDKYIISLTLRDTSGQEQYRSLTAQYYRDTHGAVIVYDISNRDTFEYLSEWVSDIDNYCPSGVEVIVVGNKLDLADNDMRMVSTDEGQRFASEKAYDFFETSAKLNIKVEEAFRDLVDKILQSENIQQKTGEPSPVNLTVEPTEVKQQKCC